MFIHLYFDFTYTLSSGGHLGMSLLGTHSTSHSARTTHNCELSLHLWEVLGVSSTLSVP